MPLLARAISGPLPNLLFPLAARASPEPPPLCPLVVQTGLERASALGLDSDRGDWPSTASLGGRSCPRTRESLENAL
jgi:hypothetical protein